LGLPVGVTTGLVTVSIAGGPDVLSLVAVGLLGKETVQFFIRKAKQTIWATVWVEWVSKPRYYIGLEISVAGPVPAGCLCGKARRRGSAAEFPRSGAPPSSCRDSPGRKGE
jgi:hypothetical protein